jgi:hypothetical protein
MKVVRDPYLLVIEPKSQGMKATCKKLEISKARCNRITFARPRVMFLPVVSVKNKPHTDTIEPLASVLAPLKRACGGGELLN